ncbi:MAG: hypothetical protein SGPRY_002718 [Prymnesium sp.]
MSTQDDDVQEIGASKIHETKQRDIVLLSQISKVGRGAFELAVAAPKQRRPSSFFKGVKWPSMQSVIIHVTLKQSDLVFKVKHLCTEGMEELYNEVRAEKWTADGEMEIQVKKSDSMNEQMQDEACEGEYQMKNREERTGIREKRKAARARSGATPDGSTTSQRRPWREQLDRVKQHGTTQAARNPKRQRARAFSCCLLLNSLLVSGPVVIKKFCKEQLQAAELATPQVSFAKEIGALSVLKCECVKSFVHCPSPFVNLRRFCKKAMLCEAQHGTPDESHLP